MELNKCPHYIIARDNQEPLFTCGKGHPLNDWKNKEQIFKPPVKQCVLLRRTSELTGKPLEDVSCLAVVPEPKSPKVIG